MSGLFGTKAGILSDVNLVLQIVILILLIRGRQLAKGKKLQNHGMTMTLAVILHSLAILLVMVPSFAFNFGTLTHVSDLGVIITWIHAVVGTLADGLGIFAIAVWRSHPQSMIACAKRKKYMKPTFILWVAAVTLGIVFYALYYL